jgi:hypothetical protein
MLDGILFCFSFGREATLPRFLRIHNSLTVLLSSLILDSDSGGSDSGSSDSLESSIDSASFADSSGNSSTNWRRDSANSSAQASDSSGFSDESSSVVALSASAGTSSPEYEERRRGRLGSRVSDRNDFNKIPFKGR